MAIQVEIQSTPDHAPWMEVYSGQPLETVQKKKTDKGVTAVEVITPDGPLWIAARHLRRVEEEES